MKSQAKEIVSIKPENTSRTSIKRTWYVGSGTFAVEEALKSSGQGKVFIHPTPEVCKSEFSQAQVCLVYMHK